MPRGPIGSTSIRNPIRKAIRKAIREPTPKPKPNDRANLRPPAAPGGMARARNRLPKLRLLPLVAATFFMVSGGPYGIEDILGGAGYGLSLAILLLLPLVWVLPTNLMIGELATALPEEGGFYVWVRRALGPFWGYQEAWLSLAASVFDMAIYPTLFVLYLGRIAPALTAGPRAALWSLAVVLVCCLWNLRGAPLVGRGSVALAIALLAPFVWLVAAGLGHGLSHLYSAWSVGAPIGARPPAPPGAGRRDLAVAILVAMWNYMGWDNASTVAREVENPQRTYPLTMLASALLVTASYVLPLAAIAAAGIPVDRFATGAWTDAGRLLGGPLLALAIGVGGMINGGAMFNALVLSYTRLPTALARDGMLPGWIAARNRYGAPWAAILVCGAAWALALSFGFERLISMDLILYGSSLILEFVALAVLRKREPLLPRPFSAGKGLASACLLGAGPTALILYAVFAARGERMADLPTLAFGGLLAAAGPLLYLCSRPGSKRRGLAFLARPEAQD